MPEPTSCLPSETPFGRLTHGITRTVSDRFAASEPRHPALRADRNARARAGLREPRLPPRRAGTDPPAPGHAALDRLPPRVQGLASHEAPPARQVHGALLPRRGDRVRSGTSSLRP